MTRPRPQCSGVETCAKTIAPTKTNARTQTIARKTITPQDPRRHAGPHLSPAARIETLSVSATDPNPQPEPPTAASVWLVMMKAHRSLQALMERSIASLGIGLSDFMILEALLHKGAMKISALGETVHLANGSMTAAVDRMADRGLVTRLITDPDRRVRTVDLTPCGRALIQQLYNKHEADIDALMAPLCPTERTALRTSLKKVGLAAQSALQTS